MAPTPLPFRPRGRPGAGRRQRTSGDQSLASARHRRCRSRRDGLRRGGGIRERRRRQQRSVRMERTTPGPASRSRCGRPTNRSIPTRWRSWPTTQRRCACSRRAARATRPRTSTRAVRTSTRRRRRVRRGVRPNAGTASSLPVDEFGRRGRRETRLRQRLRRALVPAAEHDPASHDPAPAHPGHHGAPPARTAAAPPSSRRRRPRTSRRRRPTSTVPTTLDPTTTVVTSMTSTPTTEQTTTTEPPRASLGGRRPEACPTARRRCGHAAIGLVAASGQPVPSATTGEWTPLGAALPDATTVTAFATATSGAYWVGTDAGVFSSTTGGGVDRARCARWRPVLGGRLRTAHRCWRSRTPISCSAGTARQRGSPSRSLLGRHARHGAARRRHDAPCSAPTCGVYRSRTAVRRGRPAVFRRPSSVTRWWRRHALLVDRRRRRRAGQHRARWRDLDRVPG